VYDKLGNRTTLKHNGTDVARYQHNDVNEYTYIGLDSGTNVTHDDAGNMTADHNGYTYHYDYENRLTRVKKSNDTVDWELLSQKPPTAISVLSEAFGWFFVKMF
jgi:hypothetical protein